MIPSLCLKLYCLVIYYIIGYCHCITYHISPFITANLSIGKVVYLESSNFGMNFKPWPRPWLTNTHLFEIHTCGYIESYNITHRISILLNLKLTCHAKFQLFFMVKAAWNMQTLTCCRKRVKNEVTILVHLLQRYEASEYFCKLLVLITVDDYIIGPITEDHLVYCKSASMLLS